MDKRSVIVEVRATGHSATLLPADGTRLRPIQPSNDAALLAEIGRIALLSAYVERLLDRMIWLLVGGDPATAALETRKLAAVEQRFDKIVASGAGKPQFDTEVAVPLAATRQKAIDLWAARARIIHDPWYLEEDGVSACQFRAMPKKGVLRTSLFVPVVPAKMAAAVHGLAGLWNELAPIS